MRVESFERLQRICAAIGCSSLWLFAGILALGIVIDNTPLMVIGGIPLAICCCFGLGFTGPFFLVVPLVLMFWALWFWIKAVRCGWSEALKHCY